MQKKKFRINGRINLMFETQLQYYQRKYIETGDETYQELIKLIKPKKGI